MKTRTLDTFEGFFEINEAPRRRHGKDAESARDPKALISRDENPFPIIHQDQVGMDLDGECDSVSFARVQRFELIEDVSSLTHLGP